MTICRYFLDVTYDISEAFSSSNIFVLKFQTLPAVGTHIPSGSKSHPSKKWPIKLPRSKKTHSTSSFSSSTSTVKQGPTPQHSIDAPPPRPPPPLSRKGSSANDRASQESHAHSEELFSQPSIESQSVRNIFK